MREPNSNPQVESNRSAAQPDSSSQQESADNRQINQHAQADRESENAGTAELQRVTQERDNLLDRLARTQAEFENARKRAAREQHEFQDFALTDALRSLLPIVDSFDRALQAPAENLEKFRSGVELIRKQLQDVLSRLGLRQIPANGEPFDPFLHEAVEVVDSPTGEENRVLYELERGYKLRDRLLRPARVAVARSPERKAG